LRGLHFQAPPAAQAKLVWATSGAIFDVAVDIRKGSPTYGQWHGLVLSRSNRLRFFVPEGFAHGYMTLEPDTEVQYKVNAYYSPEHEGGLRFDDPALAVAWPGLKSVMADRDRAYPLMEAFQSPFEYRKKR
jgi:dTDP-4-dehydrorhamnose 3,5-epimerase